MNAISKRDFLSLAGGALSVGVPAAASGIAAVVGPTRLAIYDSRITESRYFAGHAAQQGLRLFDIAGQDDALWRDARAGFGRKPREEVIGLTRWTDWVNLRGLLNEQGLRLTREVRFDCCTKGVRNAYGVLTEMPAMRGPVPLASQTTRTLFGWAMA